MRGAARTRVRLPAADARTEVPLVAEGVDLHVGRRVLLRGVDLRAHRGEVLALVGPNGAGKSTLLSALAGDRRVDAGHLELAGMPLASWSWRELAMRRAVLPQDVALSFPFSAREVVEMGRAPWAGTAAAGDDELAVSRAIERVEVAHLTGRAVTTLSGGERARVALARVLAQDVGVLLLDEPTAALDLRHQELVLRIAREDAAAGAAVVVVLHDLGLAAAHADRVALLGDGRLHRVGTPAEVLTGDLLSAVYRCPVEVVAHPRTGQPLVLARR